MKYEKPVFMRLAAPPAQLPHLVGELAVETLVSNDFLE
jgi:hypothetical protein